MTTDRVRANTSRRINRRIDQDMEERVWEYAQASREVITQRINELEREWDIERWLETNASVAALSGIALGLAHDRRWFIVPGVVLPFLLLHAVQGWCPPLPVLRRLGVRSREEIEREKYALKVLRGDFRTPDGLTSVDAALIAVGT